MASRSVLPRFSSEHSSSGLTSKWSSMADLPRPVTMTIWSHPAASASSTPYWMMGLSTSASISLGMDLVAGRKRVPKPAAGKIALRTLIDIVFREFLPGIFGFEDDRAFYRETGIGCEGGAGRLANPLSPATGRDGHRFAARTPKRAAYTGPYVPNADPFRGAAGASRKAVPWRRELAGARVSRGGRGASVCGTSRGRVSVGCGRQPLSRLLRLVGADDPGACVCAGGGGRPGSCRAERELRSIDGGGRRSGGAGGGGLSSD